MKTNAIKKLELTLATLLVFIPLILRVFEGYYRISISNYAYSQYSYIFVFLITLSGCLFLYNGTANNRHWYNIFLGLALFGVALTPHLEFKTIHNIFAGTFFLGSVASIGLSSSVAFKSLKYMISLGCLALLISHFLFGFLSLLAVEWICIVPISSHFVIKQVFNKI